MSLLGIHAGFDIAAGAKPRGICIRCGQAGIKRGGRRSFLCQKHYRFDQMRGSAKGNGKTVPGHDVLESLTLKLVEMKCPHCGRQMAWGQELGRASTVTLQHDRSGDFRLLCFSCNSRHRDCEGDSFYDVPFDHKRCADCKRVKPLTEFHKRSRPGWVGKRHYCKQCASSRATKEVRRKRFGIDFDIEPGRRYLAKDGSVVAVRRLYGRGSKSCAEWSHEGSEDLQCMKIRQFANCLHGPA